MTRLLSIVTLVLALVLFPPAALAVVSNNAVPGDSTYPIKRGLENVIYAVASLNPNTKALFAKARSDRRFQEITVLLSQGKEAGQTLNELVEQTRNAANQIDQVSGSSQKQKLLQQLSDSITKYDQGLLQMSQKKGEPPSSAQPVPTPSPVLKPTPLPSVSPSPSPSQTPDPELERIRRELEEIRRRLEEERQRQMQLQNQQNQNPTSTPNPTPTPTPTPRSTQTLSPTPKGKNMQEVPQKVNKNFEQSNQVGIQSGTGSSQSKQEE